MAKRTRIGFWKSKGYITFLAKRKKKSEATQMEYEKAYGELKEGTDWWKPKEGLHKVCFLENIGDPTKRKILVDGKEKEIEQTDVLIEVEKKRWRWSITKASGKDSLWGQILYYGMMVKDIVGKTITCIIQGEGKNRKYIIQETLELKTKQQNLKQ